MTQLTHPSGLAIAVSHGSTGRVNGLQDASTQANYLSSISYNTAGQVTGDTLGNGVTEQFGYDAARMQVTSQKAGTSSPYTNRMDLTYSYSASSGQMGVGSTAGNAGQLMSISGTINSTTESAGYTYDNYGRLVTSNQTSNGSSAQRRFAYDRWGNRTGVWDATSGGNQIQSISLQQTNNIPSNRISSVTTTGTVNYSYDAAGNVTNDGVHSYTYDSENRLVSVDSGATATYAYDHQNRRYKKTVGSTATHYVWEGAQVIAEHNGSTGAVQVDYICSGSRMIAKVASGTTSYFLRDQLSVRLTLNTSGAVVGRQAHFPFGDDFGESGTQEKHHFTSYERDAESGTDYGVNRQYAQSIGRFNRVDPLNGSIGDPQSLNRYSYVRNDPINAIDPLGLLICFRYHWEGNGSGWSDLICFNDEPGGGGSADDSGSGGGELPNEYDACRYLVFGNATMAGELLVPTGQATKLALKASNGDTNMAAMIAAIWGKESNFAPHPWGDNGPMQLTSWWRDYFNSHGMGDQILPGACDQNSRPPGNNTPFDGNVRANVFTGANILRQLFRDHNGNWAKMAEWYNGNDPNLTPEQNEKRRRKYSADVMSALPQFQKFFDCMKNIQLPR